MTEPREIARKWMGSINDVLEDMANGFYTREGGVVALITLIADAITGDRKERCGECEKVSEARKQCWQKAITLAEPYHQPPCERFCSDCDTRRRVQRKLKEQALSDTDRTCSPSPTD